jgi:hypothetical protein
MSENNPIYTDANFVQEYNALVIAYAKLEDRANRAQIERVSILLEAQALNARFDTLRGSQSNGGHVSPDFTRMVESLGHTSKDFDGNVKALRQSHN